MKHRREKSSIWRKSFIRKIDAKGIRKYSVLDRFRDYI